MSRLNIVKLKALKEERIIDYHKEIFRKSQYEQYQVTQLPGVDPVSLLLSGLISYLPFRSRRRN